MASTPAPEGVVTCCNLCARPLQPGDLFGDPCGCGGGGTLNQHEDALQLEIRRLQKIARDRGSHDVVTGPQVVEGL